MTESTETTTELSATQNPAPQPLEADATPSEVSVEDSTAPTKKLLGQNFTLDGPVNVWKVGDAVVPDQVAEAYLEEKLMLGLKSKHVRALMLFGAYRDGIAARQKDRKVPILTEETRQFIDKQLFKEMARMGVFQTQMLTLKTESMNYGGRQAVWLTPAGRGALEAGRGATQQLQSNPTAQEMLTQQSTQEAVPQEVSFG